MNGLLTFVGICLFVWWFSTPFWAATRRLAIAFGSLLGVALLIGFCSVQHEPAMQGSVAQGAPEKIYAGLKYTGENPGQNFGAGATGASNGGNFRQPTSALAHSFSGESSVPLAVTVPSDRNTHTSDLAAHHQVFSGAGELSFDPHPDSKFHD